LTPVYGPTRPSASARGSSDLLVRLDLLAEAERARFAPRLRQQGVDPIAARRVAQVRDELFRIARRLRRHAPNLQDETPDEATILRWVTLAYPDRVSRRRGGEATGVMVGGRGVRLDRESVVRDSDYFIALDPREDRRGKALEARVGIASSSRVEWLEEFFPNLIRREVGAQYDDERQRVVGVNTLWFLDLILREDRNAPVDPSLASKALADALRPRASEFFQQDEAAKNWLARLELLRTAMPELDWPDVEDSLGDILEEACAGRKSLDELKRAGPVTLLKGRLSFAQNRTIDEQAPEATLVPSGNRIRISYESGRPPTLAVRLQELFGLKETPKVAGGRVAILLHLLGPNYRPVQITDDLRSFWSTTYFQVRKDLRARYPKHSWPEDPLTARAEAKGGRRS
ncbi:ATP-dependent helicase C-terminal domain-containing protein, partial [Singulisphaera rosea]